MNQTQIFTFLFTPDFIASSPCMDEWEYAQSLAERDPAIFRIPIILRPCAWQDVLDNDDVKALPNDGKPISDFSDQDRGWLEVYEGIKRVLEYLRTQFSPRPDFVKTIERTEFLSQDHLSLRDIYVFPSMTQIDLSSIDDAPMRENVNSIEDVFQKNKSLIHGDDRIGKTALARYLYLTLIDQQKLALYLDLSESHTGPPSRLCRRAFNDQFIGDYDEWLARDQKTLIVDNLSSKRQSLNIINFAKRNFVNIVAITHSDVFLAFFKDEPILSDFRVLSMQPFSHVQQEQLIRKRLELSDGLPEVTHGLVDELERDVNSIILSRRILPRYPFYILSILQTREGYMPGNMAITSYGDCYQALIVANLVRAGVREYDIATSFNFAEKLAFATYRHRSEPGDECFDFDSFVAQYRETYVLRESLVNRLKEPTYGMINDDGSFHSNYMYHFFLGRFLANDAENAEDILEEMCETSYREAHYLTLLFTIHHTNDRSIVDDILLRTMSSLDTLRPATLSVEETSRFGEIISHLPEAVMSSVPISESRREQRALRDELARHIGDNDDEIESDLEIVNGIYMILKNNKIMGQVLRNRYGTLEKSRIEEIVEVVADGGLRLVNFLLVEEDQLSELASYYHEKNPEWNLSRIKRALTALSFVWTIINVEEIVGALSVPEIDEAVDAVVSRKDTPAYDIVGYFRKLDSARNLTRSERDALEALFRRNTDPFVRRVVSIRTQNYMNTHQSTREIEQSVCNVLGVRYPRALISTR